jgi:NTP pyrophosphatase (non-canonical NTP hydrolase)
MNELLTFDTYQTQAETTAIYLDKVRAKYGDEIPEPVYKILGISYAANGLGEVGEIQGKVKKLIRDAGGEISEDSIKEIGKEIGDVLWYVAAMCKELNLNMGEIAQGNLDKLKSRKERGVIEGAGDNR